MALPVSKHISLELIQEATNNFHQDNLISTGGGLGPAYKGQLLHSGELIIARRLDRSYGLGEIEFLTEVSMLSDLDHPSLISLIGFCNEKGEKIIITSYEAKGSLSEFLPSPNLTWRQRLWICLDVANALCYLHQDKERDCAVIHRNINSHTILLDKNWEPKLSGFELSIKQAVSRFGKVILSEPIGMEEYTDPIIEKIGGVTYQGDVYSFGIVLFEILCGRLAFIENDRNEFLAPLARYHYENKTLHDIIHPSLLNQMSPKSLLIYSEIAYSCIKEEREYRSDMDYIMERLEEALFIQLQSELTDEQSKHEESLEPEESSKFEESSELQGASNHLLKHVIIDESSKLEESLEFDRASDHLLQHEILVENQHLKIPLVDIKVATDYFSERYKFESWNSMKSYNLYKVDFHHFNKENPSTVVIKRLKDGCYNEVFLKDIQILTSFKHPNIVNLVSFCVEGSEKIIVLENFHVCLFDYLEDVQKRCYLPWEKRLKICISVGQALNYLQSQMEDQKMIIEWEIHSWDIALDENFGAKIVDFEASHFFHPYLNVKSQVFTEAPPCFDEVMLRIVCGTISNKVYINCGRENFKEGLLTEFLDPIIRNEIGENTSIVTRGPNKDSLDAFVEIFGKCMNENEKTRPTTKCVITELEKALDFQVNNDNHVISLEDVKLATRNFHCDNYIGGGGFGKAYVGKLQYDDGFIVAKQLFGKGKQQFWSEIQILSEYRHENIISLVGYCDENDEKIIIYEYASRSSLDRHLNNPSLTWVTRLNICIEVASALDFLHGGVGKQAKVVYRDIKTANILLNHDWKAKLADFGLSLISGITNETDYIIDYVCGTQGYVDPLYAESKFLTTESDIYSFGVVLFEILGGRLTFAIHKREGQHLPEFVTNKLIEGKFDEVVWEQIRDQILPKSLATFLVVARRCLHHKREMRPRTKTVLKELKKALEYQVQVSIDDSEIAIDFDSEISIDDSEIPIDDYDSTIPISLNQVSEVVSYLESL